jgi:hypothetical protein
MGWAALLAPFAKWLGIGGIITIVILLARLWIRRGVGAAERERLKDKMEDDRHESDEDYHRDRSDLYAYWARLRARKRRQDLGAGR